MKKVISIFNKTSKILLLIVACSILTKVNIVSNAKKIENVNLNKTLDLTAMAYKLSEIQYNDKFSPLDSFTGDVTGYAANCPLCSGYLYCTNQYVNNGTTTYFDNTYGLVNIVASSNNLPCGSIVTFNLGDTSYTAIVLDRGVLGNDLDLLVESESYASNFIGRNKLTYDVLRFGWTR